MDLDALTAITPIDGRYRQKTVKLAQYFSEFALMRYRIWVEVEYFIALCDLPLPQLKDFDKSHYTALRNFYEAFRPEEAQEVKALEKITNHDVKAVEYFIKKRFEHLGLSEFAEFIHFGLTSQDVNNTAIPLSMKQASREVLYPNLERVIDKLEHLGDDWKEVPMLARTHGQPASPTRLGKEIHVFTYRLRRQFEDIKHLKFPAKFGGATGNFNAHHVAYPEQDWHQFADDLVNKNLGLERSELTTQIENYDQLAALFNNYARLNTVLLDLCRDIWQYIAMGYFKQKIAENEVGSSAMPHKINPIDFENAEGNLGMANAVFEHLAAKLPISRLQRDLSDSTVLRNIGVPFSHTLIALKSIFMGLEKLELNEAAIRADLENNWAVTAEALQTILRREGYEKPYETLKSLTRTGKPIDQAAITGFIEGLAVSDEIKAEMKAITPFNYTGI